MALNLRGLAGAADRLLWTGVLFGIGNTLDPIQTNRLPRWLWGPTAILLSFLIYGLFAAPLPLALAIALILSSPIWIGGLHLRYEGMLEGRYTITLLGTALALGWLASLGNTGLALSLLVIAWFGVRTWTRVVVFSNIDLFWKTAILESPGKARPMMNYGAMVFADPSGSAKRWLIRGFGSAQPGDPNQVLEIAASNLCRFFLGRGDIAAAEYWIARGFERNDNDLCRISRALLYMGTGRWAEAAEDLTRALMGPDYKTHDIILLRAQCYFNLGEDQKFTEDMERVLTMAGWNWTFSMVPEHALDRMKGEAGRGWTHIANERRNGWKRITGRRSLP